MHPQNMRANAFWFAKPSSIHASRLRVKEETAYRRHVKVVLPFTLQVIVS
jgi:hypothetical protein